MKKNVTPTHGARPCTVAPSRPPAIFVRDIKPLVPNQRKGHEDKGKGH